jgi:hypothetical protein
MAIFNSRKNAIGNQRFAVKNSCFFLLLSMLLLLFVYPYGQAHPLIILSLNGLTLIAGIYAVGTIRRHIFIVIVISAFQVLIAAIHLQTQLLILDVIATALFAVVYIYVLVIVLVYVIKGTEVTTDKILGVICIYFLIGFTWASFYRIIFSLQPEAFS